MERPRNIFLDTFRIPYEFYTPEYLYNKVKNNLTFIQRLALEKRLDAHSGCVNTLCWNDGGQLLLSGSDDHKLVITDPYAEKTIVSLRSGHRANIFSAKFMPNTSDKQVVSCSGDGLIYHTIMEQAENSTAHSFDCHLGTTYEILTVPQDPYSFLSCGEDGTVRWFDLRIKTSCNKENCKEDILINCRRAVTAIANNPIAPYLLGVGCSDSSVRIFDRRMLGTKATGNYIGRSVMGMMSRFSAPGLEDQYHRITSLNFSHDGKEMLVSYSSESLYLFDLKDSSNPQQFNAQGQSEDPADKCADRQRPIKRLRLRGDWSDTGPSARPQQERGDEQSPVDRAASTLSDILTRWLQGLSSRGENDRPSSSGDPSETVPSASNSAGHQPNTANSDGGNEETSTNVCPRSDDASSTSANVSDTNQVTDALANNGTGNDASESTVSEGAPVEHTETVSNNRTADQVTGVMSSQKATEGCSELPCVVDQGHENDVKSNDNITGDSMFGEEDCVTESKLCDQSGKSNDLFTGDELNVSSASQCDKLQLTMKTERDISSASTNISASGLSAISTQTLGNIGEMSSCDKQVTTHQSDPNIGDEDTSHGGANLDRDHNGGSSQTEGAIVFGGHSLQPLVSLHYRPEGTCTSMIRVDCRLGEHLEPGTSDLTDHIGHDHQDSWQYYDNQQPSESSEHHEGQGSRSQDRQSDIRLADSSPDTCTHCSCPDNTNDQPQHEHRSQTISNTCASKCEEHLVTSDSDRYLSDLRPSQSESQSSDISDTKNDLPCMKTVSEDACAIAADSRQPLSVSESAERSDDCVTVDHLPSLTSNNQPIVTTSEQKALDPNTAVPTTSSLMTSDPIPSAEITMNQMTSSVEPVTSKPTTSNPSVRPNRLQLHEQGTESSTRRDPSSSVEVSDDDEGLMRAHRASTTRPREHTTWERNAAARKLQELYRKRQDQREKEEHSMMQLPQPKMTKVYSGHRNSRTMIKEAAFWGTDYVMSGSDCGHVFIWDKFTAKLVMLLEGDKHVVNCIQPHPFDPVLATSGIDYDIKLWTPSAVHPGYNSNRAREILARNKVMLEETRDTITVPSSFMLRMLASLNHFRAAHGSQAQTDELSSPSSDED